MCFPIKDGDDVLGVAELCNKTSAPCFTRVDEESAMSFSIYCGISLVKGLMYKKVQDAQHRSRLSNELMMYHMKVSSRQDLRRFGEAFQILNQTFLCCASSTGFERGNAQTSSRGQHAQH